jgi:hypothetical protein
MPASVKKYHRGESTSNAVTDLRFDDRAKWAGSAEFERIYIEEFGADLRQLCRATLAHHYQVRALYEVIAGQRLNSLRSTLSALRHHPTWKHVGLVAMPFLPRPALRLLAHWSDRRYWSRMERVGEAGD